MAGVAEVIGVHNRTVHTWIERGMMVPSQAYKGGALKIALSEEQIETWRDYVVRVRRPRHVPKASQEAHGAGLKEEVDKG